MSEDSARIQDPRAAWNANAAFWDERMGEGNDFVDVLTWPATERMLGSVQGKRVLDVACGNGLTCRRLAASGAEVVGIDIAEAMIERARARGPEDASIRYEVMDAGDEEALGTLGPAYFDAALCAMALFDMAAIDPLFRSLRTLLRPGGAFVFSVLHPAFNGQHAIPFAEQEDVGGTILTHYGVKVNRYLTPFTEAGTAIDGQPSAQPLYHRPLSVLLGAAFAAGFVLDALEERAFPADHPPGRNPLGWSGRFAEIPAALVARVRRS